MTGTDWTRGVLGGAVLGGIGWGLLAVDAVGVSGGDLLLSRIDGAYLPVSVGISLLCLVIAVVLPKVGTLRTIAIALVVAPTSGWFVVGLLYMQTFAIVATWR